MPATTPSLYRSMRSSTSASKPQLKSKAFEVLEKLLQDVAASIDECAEANIREDANPQTQTLVKQIGQIRQHIAAPEPPSPFQDDFRHLGGYHTIFDALRAYRNFHVERQRTEQERKDVFNLLDAVLGVLAATFKDHPGNRRYFMTRITDGGFTTLEESIVKIGYHTDETDIWTTCGLFGKLFAFTVNDSGLEKACYDVGNMNLSNEQLDEGATQVIPADDENGGHGSPSDTYVSRMEELIHGVISPKTILQNPEMLHCIVNRWLQMVKGPGPARSTLSIFVLKLLSSLVAVSTYNLCAVYNQDVISTLISLAFGTDVSLTQVEHNIILGLCKSLLLLGVPMLQDARDLLVNSSAGASNFCLEMTQRHRSPPFIQFDLSLHGHSSIDLPSLGRPFPPQNSAGYTFCAWVRVDRFDPNSHTTIFGVCDTTQTCFLLVYLEKDTHNFILQTSMTSQRPSVRFKRCVFRENRWYHIALVHRRPKHMSASKAYLYIDGEFVEQIAASYPALPPPHNSSTESFASFTSSSSKTMPVQAFLGTPRELSTYNGPAQVFSKWSLASAHLFDEVLSDDFLAVPSRLGPRYQANFQDCLGGFQTYEASAALGLRTDLAATRGKDANSDIFKVIREKAASYIPEQRILFSMMPSSIFLEKHSMPGICPLFSALSRGPANTLMQMTVKNGTGIAINTSMPSINDALVRASGVAVLTGQPVIVEPQYFDDTLWRLAGFTPLALKIVDRASSADALLRAVEFIFRCINTSWRNSEAMERDGGYAILSILLKSKVGLGSTSGDNITERLILEAPEKEKLCFQLLSLVLEFVGYRHKYPLESVIINSLAYRILVVDFDVWRKCAPIIQELYYKQFVTFAAECKYHDYNNRRLLRMRIVKRLLDALKAESLPEDVLPFFMSALETLIKCSYNPEVHRSLALFITYAFHIPPGSHSRTPKTSSGPPHGKSQSVPRRPTVDPGTQDQRSGSVVLGKKQIGIKILEMYTKLLCERGNLGIVRKFAKTVTNKWLLFLIAEDDPEIVIYGCKILARLFVAHGQMYASKFSGKTGGFHIMADRLRRWWDIPTIWPLCFSILFGYDVAEIDFDKPFDFFSLIEAFGKCKVVHPEALSIIMSMLQHGLKDVLRNTDDPDSPSTDKDNAKSPTSPRENSITRPRARSMSLLEELETRQTPRHSKEKVVGNAATLQTVIRFLSDLHSRSVNFRDFTLSSDYVRSLLSALYPVLVNTDAVTPETELGPRDSVLNFEGNDVIIRPIGGSSAPAIVVRTAQAPSIASQTITDTLRGTPLKKTSPFVLLTTVASTVNNVSRLANVMSPKKVAASQNMSNAALEGILELVINVFMDQVLVRKEFPGFGLFIKVPPGFQEHQAYFESYVLRRTILHLSGAIKLDWNALHEPRVLTNMARFSLHIVEAIYEGWFINGAGAMLDFVGMLLEHLNKPEISSLKSVRLCSSASTTMRSSFLKLVLLKLSELDDPQTTDEIAASSMYKILYWQMVVLESLTADDGFVKLLWYQLYTKLVDHRVAVRQAAVTLWRIMLVQKPEECKALFNQCITPDQALLARGFKELSEMDTDNFLGWVEAHRTGLDKMFLGSIARAWEDFVVVENNKTAETSSTRLNKRRDTLKKWRTEAQTRDNIILQHNMASSAWKKSIYGSEHFKFQRALQDKQDDLTFNISRYAKMGQDLSRFGGVFYKPSRIMWKVDRTEGRNRMRIRMLPDSTGRDSAFQPKRRTTDPQAFSNAKPAMQLSSGLSTPSSAGTSRIVRISRSKSDLDGPADDASFVEALPDSQDGSSVVPDDDFEMVDDPNDPADGDEGFEDKNRRVMRRLEQGDVVQHVYNTSRIIGLEACEGILLIGKNALYIMDNFFQSADGEIVNVWDAPLEERDPYSQIIRDQKANEKKLAARRSLQESRSWRWHDVISLSKRRFLFRDVAIEIFFTDGRSYLLTALNQVARDEIYARLQHKIPHTAAASSLPNPEDAWRLESLKVSSEDSQQSLSSKFGSLFNSSPSNPVTRRWQRGEMSNFHYLMLINTMAGRTFNDLTQYPVFPWILADYTSEELNLDDPASFRDLSKPMGAQAPARQADYITRYNTLAEIGEKPFHYGTHYSSAMVVASYLIRLPPFVQSFVLLQGGTFDHADRLFFSIAQSWSSASRENGSDVRELIPEFFYLPEFLTNINGYDFGERQGSGGKVNDVVLPPWAKGDPKIFIAKHREALESPYVSQNLHQWIDLVFGYKQRGEAAVDNLNVFHWLSYHGAKDLDNITDAQERTATTSTIHNFGQTPHQVFTKPHPPRENVGFPAKRLDTASYALARIPHPLLESHERVASLIYSSKLDRLLCSSPFRLNLPPFYDKYLEWGFSDKSVRFYFTENRRSAGVNENMHIGQISCVVVADSKTLITAGEDCVVSVYTIQTAPGKPVELLFRSSLFGHKWPVTLIAVSRAFSTLVTIDRSGETFLWDLNRLEFVRRLKTPQPAAQCVRINDVSGEIMIGSGEYIALYTLNGEEILKSKVGGRDSNTNLAPPTTATTNNQNHNHTNENSSGGGEDSAADPLFACAFYEGSGDEWLENYLIFTGHTRGRVKIWKCVVKGDRWGLELVRRLDHVDPRSETGANTEAAITCITPMPQVVYTGDDDGRVFEWNLVQRER